MTLPTKVLPDAVLNKVKRSKLVYSLGRRVRFRIGSALGARHVEGIPGRCHYNDFMLKSTSPEAVAAYRNSAVQFVGILANALNSVGKTWTDVDRVLEIGCGYGRIIRVLKEHVPPSKIYVSDVIEEGAHFSATEFGVNKMPILEDVKEGYREFFDLIFMLSVYTHTPVDFMHRHVKLVSDALRPNGLCVFATQGPISAKNAEQYSQDWLDKELILKELQEKGYSFQQYPHYYDRYGMTWHTEDYIRETIRKANVPLRFLSYRPAEHDGHQDIFVYQKHADGSSQ